MSAQWQPREIKDWKGLLDRRQRIADLPEALGESWNLSGYGGALAKRGGTVLLTGVTRRVVSGDEVTVVLDQPWPITKIVGMTVRIYYPDGQLEVGTIDDFGAANELHFHPALLTAPPANSVVLFEVPLGDDGGTVGTVAPASRPVRGLFSPLYRDRKAYLIAVSNSRIYEPSRVKISPETIAPIAEFPPGVDMPPWAGTFETPWATFVSATAGEPLFNGDRIRVTSAEGARWGGPVRFMTDAGLYQGRIVWSVRAAGGMGPGEFFDVVKVDPPPIGTPANDAVVSYWDVRDDLETYGGMLGNNQFLFFDQNATPVVGWDAPVKIRDAGSERRLQQMGLAQANQEAGGDPFLVDWEEGPPAVDGNGLAAGHYSYRYVWRNTTTGQTSEPGVRMTRDGTILALDGINAATTVVTVDGNTMILTIRWNCDPQVDQVDVYRTTVAVGSVPAAGPWYLVGSAPNTRGTDIVFTDNVPDLRLGRQLRQFLDYQPPADLRMAIFWPAAQRAIGFTASPAAVVFSDGPDLEDGTFKFESWPAGNQLFIGLDDGDEYVGLAAFFDSIIVFKRHGAYRISGVPPSTPGGEDGTIKIEPIHFRDDRTSLGAVSGKAILQDKNELRFAAHDGIYQLNRYQDADQGFESSRLSTAVDRRFVGIAQPAGMQGIPNAIYMRDWRRALFFYPGGLQLDLGMVSPTLVYQFGSDTEEPEGWSTWAFSRLFPPPLPGVLPVAQGPGSNRAPILQSCVYPSGAADNTPPEIYGNGGSNSQNDLGPSAMILADDSGHIIQGDYGDRDYGGFPYRAIMETTWSAYSGRGRQTRMRALDLILDVRAASAKLRLEVESELTTAPVVLPFTITGSDTVDESTWDYLATTLNELFRRFLVSVPGEFHRFRVTEAEDGADLLLAPILTSGLWTLLATTAWYQALSQRTVDRTTAQAELPPVPNL